MEELSREAKTILYAYLILEDLKQKGLVEGGFFKVADINKAKKELEGFRPTEEELKAAMAAIMKYKGGNA